MERSPVGKAKGTARPGEASLSSRLSPLNGLNDSCEIVPIATHGGKQHYVLTHAVHATALRSRPDGIHLITCSNLMGVISAISFEWIYSQLEGVVD